MSWLARAREDVDAVIARDPAATSRLSVALLTPGLHAIWAHRRQHWLWEHGMRGLARFLARRTQRRYGVDIHPAAQVGRRLVIDHGVGVVIGQTAVIGDDCLIYQGVTLGMTGKKTGKRHPTLGDRVMVGAGAIVLGDIVVGDDVRVAAGSVVLHDVPACSTVAGNPAKVVRSRTCPMLEHAGDPAAHAGGKRGREAGGCGERPDAGDGTAAGTAPTAVPEGADEDVRWSCSL